MPTRFVCIGDFHAAPGLRRTDRYDALNAIVDVGRDLARAGTLGAWLWTGDIFDALSTTEERNALDGVFLEQARYAPVVIPYGNHDRPGDLDGFANLRGTFPIHVVSRPLVIRLKLPTERHAAIFVLPYPSKAALVGHGLAPGDVVPTAAELLEPIFVHAAHELTVAAAAGDLTLMIGHCNVSGSIASTGQPNIGKEIEISAAHLDRLGPVPKILGHIHKPQQIAGAHYVGSVCRLNYGETEEKRFLIVDYPDDRTLEPAIISKPLQVAPMFLIEGDFEDGTLVLADIDGEIDRRFEANDWAGCDVRLRYRYRDCDRPLIEGWLGQVLPRFVSALRFKHEGVAMKDRDIRSPEVAAASTLAGKLAAYAKVDRLDPGRAEKLALLDAGDEAALIEHVAVTLKAIEQPAVSAERTVAA